MIESGQTNQQLGASVSILRIIKTAPSTHFAQVTGLVLEGLLNCFKKKSLACAHTCIECVMSIILYSDKDVPAFIDSILGVLIEQVCHKSPLVRKAALDTIHTMCVVCPDELRYYKDEMIETVKVVKNDADKRVVEAAQEALKAVRALQTERDNESEADLNPQQPIKQVSKSIDKFSQKQQQESKANKKGPKKEYGINKMQVNPNFMKAGSDQIEIFVNETKKPATQPLESQERLSQTFNDTRESNFMEAESAVFQQDSFKDNPRLREKPALPEEPHKMMRKKKEEEASNIFKDFEDDHSNLRNSDGGRYSQNQKPYSPMDEEHRYTPSPPPVPPRQPDRQTNRQRTPEQSQVRPMADLKLRRDFADEQPQAEQQADRTQDSISQKVVKTNDYETRQLRKLFDGLKRENQSQVKVIEHQNKRIDSLVSHVQNMTLHMNHLLAKVNQLEQNLFQISNTRSQPPQQIILPPYSFPIGPQISSIGLQQMMPQQQYQPQQFLPPQQPLAAPPSKWTDHPDKTSSKENKWKRKADDGKRRKSEDDEKPDRARKKDKLRVDAIPLDVRDTNEDKKRLARNKEARPVAPSGGQAELHKSDEDTAQQFSSDQKAFHTVSSKRHESHRKLDHQARQQSPKHSEHSESDDERSEEDSRSDLSEDSRPKARELNQSLRSVMSRDSRKMLDFLSDFDHLGGFSLLSRSNLQKLCVKLTEFLASRVETNVGVVLPWIDQYVQHGSLKRKEDVRAILSGVKVILSSNKSSKMYQQSTLEKLEALRQDLDKLA